MNLDSFTGPGSTPSRRRFWDKVTQAVNASQKLEGKNISVDEHQGYGSLISVDPQRRNTQGPPTDVCCAGVDPIILTISGAEICPTWPDFNGVYEFPAVASQEWGGFVDYTDPFPFSVAFDIQCVNDFPDPGDHELRVTLDSGGGPFFEAIGPAPGPVNNVNTVTCDDGNLIEGGTGTASISCS